MALQMQCTAFEHAGRGHWIGREDPVPATAENETSQDRKTTISHLCVLDLYVLVGLAALGSTM